MKKWNRFVEWVRTHHDEAAFAIAVLVLSCGALGLRVAYLTVKAAFAS